MNKTEVNSLAMQTGKVMYVFGILETESVLSDDRMTESRIYGLDEMYYESEKIALDWINNIDTDNFEEEGYILPYAERVIMERYGK